MGLALARGLLGYSTRRVPKGRLRARWSLLASVGLQAHHTWNDVRVTVLSRRPHPLPISHAVCNSCDYECKLSLSLSHARSRGRLHQLEGTRVQSVYPARRSYGTSKPGRLVSRRQSASHAAR